MAEQFLYDVDFRLAPFWAVFGLRPSKDGVTLTDEADLVATFGPFRLSTPRANVQDAHVTRNYRWWTAAGARLSFADDGLTFGTNNHAGVCIHFHERVPTRLRRSGHSALTVTVKDLDRLAARLTAS